MNPASFGHFCRSWSATWRSVWLACARSGWMNAWRSAAATEARFELDECRLTSEYRGCDPPHQEAEMVNVVDLARLLADIASRTGDPNTARELMILVDQYSPLPACLSPHQNRH
jgi:hypothetical protein